MIELFDMNILIIGLTDLLSRSIGKLPVFGNWSVISDNLSVSCPNSQNSLFSADSCSSGISTGAKPVILRCSSGSSSEAAIGDSIDSLTKHFIQKQNIIWDNSCSEMVLKGIAALNNSVNILISIRNNNLERTEQFNTAQIEILLELF